MLSTTRSSTRPKTSRPPLSPAACSRVTWRGGSERSLDALAPPRWRCGASAAGNVSEPMKSKYLAARWRWRLTPHRTAMIATITAVVAVLLGFWGQWETRRYYRLSMRPSLAFSTSIHRDGFRITLFNQGPGRADVGWFRVAVEGKNVHSYCELEERLGSTEIPIGGLSVLRPGDRLLPEGQVILYHVSDPGHAAFLFANTHRISLGVCFCSMYEECWIGTSSSTRDKTEAVKRCVATDEDYRWDVRCAAEEQKPLEGQ